ncbi:MAG: FHA domain-containing protein [Acidimicrobiia bacterium]|nr:FHA domain-containing protein [Acidimicrobiia bacterium]
MSGDAYLEVWGPAGARLVPLSSDRTTIGRAPSNDVAIDADATVSKLHAVLVRYGDEYAVRDVGSSNGTFLNGERVVSEIRLRPGDEIRAGETRLVFRAQGGAELEATAAAEGPPRLTRREQEVLIALCRPMASGAAFAQPATVKHLAEEFVVSEAAIKAHLANLYDKFEIYEPGESRRVRLANEAIRRRAVSLADLRTSG